MTVRIGGAASSAAIHAMAPRQPLPQTSNPGSGTAASAISSAEASAAGAIAAMATGSTVSVMA